MIPLQSNHPISTLVSILFTMQWFILMNNPTPKSIIQLLSEKLLFHSVFLSLFYPHNQILSTGSRTRDRTLIHHLLSNGKNPYHTQLLLLKQTSPITLNPSTNQIRVKVATLQQLLMSSLSRYHTIVNHEDGIHMLLKRCAIIHGWVSLHAFNAVKNVS